MKRQYGKRGSLELILVVCAFIAVSGAHPVACGDRSASGGVNSSAGSAYAVAHGSYPVSGGATASEAEPITLRYTVQTALESNISLRRAGILVDSRRIAVSSSTAEYLPDLSVSLRSSNWYGRQYDSSTNSFARAHLNSASLQLSSSVDVFTGFGRTASVRQSKLELAAEENNLAYTRQAVIFDVITRYLQVVIDSELIRVNREHLEAQRYQLEQIDAFYRAGRRPVADLYQQQAEVSDAEGRLLGSERTYEVDMMLLLETMGVDPGRRYRVVEPDVNGIIASIETAGDVDVLEDAYASRPDLAAQKEYIDAATKQIAASRAGYWPSLSLFANAGTNYSSTMSDYYGFSDQFYNNNLEATIGVSLSIPIFDRFRTINNVKQARVQLRQEQLDLEKLKLQIAVEIRQAHEDYNTAKKEVEVAEARLRYTGQALSSIEERYNVGAATLIELIQSRASNLQASTDVTSARYTLVLRGIAVAFYRSDIDEVVSFLE